MLKYLFLDTAECSDKYICFTMMCVYFYGSKNAPIYDYIIFYDMKVNLVGIQNWNFPVISESLGKNNKKIQEKRESFGITHIP